jgi:hypothetical protein
MILDSIISQTGNILLNRPTPLVLACYYSRLEIVEILLRLDKAKRCQSDGNEPADSYDERFNK